MSTEDKNRVKKPFNMDERKHTSDVTNTTTQDFDSYGLSENLLKGIHEKGFHGPSPIQEITIPLLLKGESILARAKNGTGKTAAFCIPMLQLIDPTKKAIQGVVLVPTRELALQTAAVLKELSKHLNIDVASVTGGTIVRDDILRVQQKPHIVVATPGRFVSLARSNNVMDLSKVIILALDEADKLLSIEGRPDIEDVIKNYLPKKFQIALLSATFPHSVKSFCTEFAPNAISANTMENLTLVGVTQYYAAVKEDQKLRCLYELFRRIEVNQCVIFCNTVSRVEKLQRALHQWGFESYFIHGNMSTEDRSKVFHSFRHSAVRYLVSTDVITRGIDVPAVNVVINFDFPKASESYLHRIGRSGRFGQFGLAINFVTPDDVDNFLTIQDKIGTEIAKLPEKIDRSLYCE